jgi:anthranilate phosphoribosyltransferase
LSYAHYLREITPDPGVFRDLSAESARTLFGAMLDGGVPELELGALLVAFRMKGESLAELLGGHAAACERLLRLRPPAGNARPVVIPSYNGARKQPNLTPLVAMLLHRMSVPVLVHGTLEGNGRITTAHILREMGVLPSATLAQAQAALDRGDVAFVPTGVFSPGLATLLGLRARLGLRNSAHTLAKLVDPFGGEGLRVIGVTHPDYFARIHEFLLASGERAIVMRGTDGEPYANPRKRPRIEFIEDGAARVLFEQELTAEDLQAPLPDSIDAKATATYVRRVLAGRAAVPLPILNQLACCLYASGYAPDFNQAKAIVAVQAHTIAAA